MSYFFVAQTARHLVGCVRSQFADLGHNLLSSTQGLEGGLSCHQSSCHPAIDRRNCSPCDRTICRNQLSCSPNRAIELCRNAAGKTAPQQLQHAGKSFCLPTRLPRTESLSATGAPALQELRLAGNRIAAAVHVRMLSCAAQLRRLTLAGNPLLDGMTLRAGLALVRNACPGAVQRTKTNFKRSQFDNGLMFAPTASRRGALQLCQVLNFTATGRHIKACTCIRCCVF